MKRPHLIGVFRSLFSCFTQLFFKINQKKKYTTLQENESMKESVNIQLVSELSICLLYAEKLKQKEQNRGGSVLDSRFMDLLTF